MGNRKDAGEYRHGGLSCFPPTAPLPSTSKDIWKRLLICSKKTIFKLIHKVKHRNAEDSGVSAFP